MFSNLIFFHSSKVSRWQVVQCSWEIVLEELAQNDFNVVDEVIKLLMAQCDGNVVLELFMIWCKLLTSLIERQKSLSSDF